MSRTPLLLVALGVLAGSLLAVQAAINAQLSRGLGHPVLAAVVSFSAGLAALVASAVLLGLAIPSRATRPRRSPPTSGLQAASSVPAT